MKTFILKLSACMALAGVSIAGTTSADVYGAQFGMGYRQDSIRWDMEESAQINPRIKSNLHFEDLEIFVLGAKFKGLIGNSFYGRIGFDYGWICDGKLRQTLSVTKREEVRRFAQSGVSVEGDYDSVTIHDRSFGNNYVWDLNIAFGMPFSCFCDEFQIAPMIGFSYNRQHLKYRNHGDVRVHVSHRHADIVPSSEDRGVHSTFNTGWWGPMIGLDFTYVSPQCWSAFGEFEFHFGRVERDRSSACGVDFFDKYKRTKDFWGTSWRAGFNYIICEDWYVEAAVSYARWMSHYTKDHIDWSTAAIRADLGYLF
jgi:hypothetical protein